MTEHQDGFTKQQKDSIDWFDRNIKFDAEDWGAPVCSRCQKEKAIVTEAFGYGSVYHLCVECARIRVP